MTTKSAMEAARDIHSEVGMRYWRADGKWWCAVPGLDPFGFIEGRGKDWWKRFGRIGRGETREAALQDWRQYALAMDIMDGSLS